MQVPAPGTVVNANLCRTEQLPDAGGSIFSSWNAVYHGFLEPYSFGEWVFAP